MRLIITFLLMALGFQVDGQIVVPQTTKSLYGIVEATWCGVCGQYGKPSTENIISQTTGKAVYFGLHKSASSLLHATVATDLANEFNASGQPIFTVNGTNLGAYSPTVVNETVTEIETYYNASGAAVNAGYEYGIVGDTLYVHTKTEFFQDLTGEYFVAIYVVEDSIWEWQVNYDPGIADMDIWHNHILRASLNGSFGEQVAAGIISSGTTVNKNAKLKLNSSWNPQNLNVVTVIWKKNGADYEFVNVNDAGTVISGQAGVGEALQGDVLVYPNPATAYLYVSGIEIDDQTQLMVFDMQGKLVLNLTGDSIIDVRYLQSGYYVLKLTTSCGTLTRRFYKD